jgi:hypothetical protein
MGQHYIPQYYLKGFSDSPTSSNIWVYEKGSNQIFRRPINRVASENYRWPKSTEQYLANQVEAPANIVLDKIRNRQPITQGDKDVFSAYMVVMLQRVPRGLERARALAPAIAEQIFDSLRGDILKLITEHPSKKSVLQNRLQELPSLKSKYESDFPMEVWYQNLKPDALPRLRVVLPAMTWTFLTSDKRQPFLTNDNPVFFFESLGIGRPESEITFPISSTIALWATWRTNLVEGYSTAKDVIIRETNRRIASGATRYVYYSIKAPWVVSLINKRNPRLHRMT